MTVSLLMHLSIVNLTTTTTTTTTTATTATTTVIMQNKDTKNVMGISRLNFLRFNLIVNLIIDLLTRRYSKIKFFFGLIRHFSWPPLHQKSWKCFEMFNSNLVSGLARFLVRWWGRAQLFSSFYEGIFTQKITLKLQLLKP